MASNLSKGYQDIGKPTTRSTTRPGTPTAAGKPRQQVVTTPTETKPATAPPKGKAPAKPRYERMVEKDTPSHRISESRTEIKDAYEKFKADLDEADRLYFHARRRVDHYGGQGMVRDQEELKYAEDLKAWQEENKQRFKGWVDTVVERNKGNTKAPGTFNNMLDDAEEAFAEIDSRRPPEQYYTDRIATSRAKAIKKEDTLPVEPTDPQANVVSNLGGLVGPEAAPTETATDGTGEVATKPGMYRSASAAAADTFVGPDGKPLFTPEEIEASADKSGYDTTPKGIRFMFENMINEQAKKSNMTKEQVYKLQKDLDAKLEVVDLEAQISDAKRKLEAKPKKDEGAWGFIKGQLGDFANYAVDVGSRGLDLASRPLYAVAQGTEALAKSGEVDFGDIARTAGAAWHGFSGQSKRGFSEVIRDAYIANGGDFDTWFENWGIGGVGLVADVAGDPLTYVTFGTSTLGKKAALEAAEELGASKRVVKALVEETFPTVRKSRKAMTAGEVATKTAKFEEAISKAPDVVQAANIMKNDEVLRRTALGVVVDATEKQRIFDEAIATVTKGDGAIYEAAMLSGQKPRIALKIVGKDLGDIPAVGRAFEKAHVPLTAVSKAYKTTSFGRTMAQMFSMRAHFPGFTDRLRRVVEGNGLVTHQRFQSGVDKFLKGLSKDDRKMITNAIEGGQDLTGHLGTTGMDLGDAQREAIRLSDNMWDEKVALGVADPGHKANNYVFHYYRGDSGVPVRDLKTYKLDRKSRLRRGVPAPTLQDAARDGMKPYQDIGDVLKLQHADHQRKLSKVLTNTEFVDKYGLLTHNPAVAAANGLVDITHKLPKNIQAVGTKQGKRWYIHKDLEKVFTSLDKLHSLDNTEEMRHLMRFFTRTTNWWKSTATVYNPGNWINNSMGDLALNYFDGVQNPIWYKRAYEVVIRGKKQGDKVILKLGSRKITQKEAWDLYERFGASSGFLRAEVDEVVGRVLPGARHKIHAAYQHREDFTRFAHFLYSLEDEFKRVGKKVETGSLYKHQPIGKGLTGYKGPLQITAAKPGVTSILDKRIEAAAYAASDRVAKFNIDYSAFTPFERKLKGGAVPFYSWMRKAFPLMLENMVQRPGRYSALAKAQKAVERSLGVDPGEQGYYNVHVPGWLQQAGSMRLSGGPNPLMIKNPLPSNIIPGVMGDGTIQGTLANMLSKTHPLIQTPIELLTGEKLFSGAKINDPTSYLMDKFPMFKPIAAVSPWALPGQKELTPAQRVGTLLGSKPTKVDSKVQAGELRRQQDPLNQQVRQLNQEIYPIQIEHTDKGFVVTNDENGRRFNKIFTDPMDAYKVALALKKQDGSPPGSGG